MFTGIVKEIGRIAALERSEDGVRLGVEASFAGELSEGDSIAVDGVCLTATGISPSGFEADAMNQTLGLTTFGGLADGAAVNLEPALRAGDPLGGHIVQGHVDGVAEVTRSADDGFARRLELAIPPELRNYVIERGSVTLAGVSLTVASLTEDGFEVSLIPETLERTTLGEAAAGTRLNLEIDPVARYVERLLTGFRQRS